MFEDARHGNHTRRPEARPPFAWAALLGLTALACTTTEPTVTLEVYNWWQEGSEKAAFDEVRSIHQERHPNVEVLNLAGENAAAPNTRLVMAGRMLAGAPPATFQANLGADLLYWTVVDAQPAPARSLTEEPNEYRLIQRLDAFFDDENLRGDLRPGLLDELAVDGDAAPFGVPINVHRLNVIYYRPDKLAEFQSRPGNEGKSFLDLETLCPEGAYDPDASDRDLALDIVIGAGRDGQAWTLLLLTLENVLPAVIKRRVGGDPVAARIFYDALFRGEMPEPRDPLTGGSEYVREALECVQYLSRWFRRIPDRSDDTLIYDPAVGWAEAVDAVKGDDDDADAEDNDAAFTVMGDWANGLLQLELLGKDVEPREVASQAFPGTEGLFVYTSDTFPLPRGTAHPKEARDFLETIGLPEAQIAFSRKKGSVPARLSASVNKLHVWQRNASDAFAASEHLLATSGYFPPYYPQQAFWRVLIEMTAWDVVKPGASSEDRAARVDAALRVFTENEQLLKFWQDRLKRGPAEDALP